MADPRHIVFSGGGVNGIAHLGAVIALLRAGYLDKLEAVAGTSAGAIVGLGVALNFTEEEYIELFNKLEFKKVTESKYGAAGAVYNLFARGGLYSAEYVREQIIAAIKQKTGLDNPTFAELHALKKKHHLKDFYVTATNLSQGAIKKIFSHKHTPNVSVAHAIRASMSVPILFKPTRIDHKICIDGAVIDNYDTTIFPKESTLGVCLAKSQEEIAWIRESKEPAHRVLSVDKFFVEMVEGIVIKQKHEELRNNPEVLARTIFVSSDGNEPFNFGLSEELKKKLFLSGQRAAEEFIARQKKFGGRLRAKL